jgi:fluoride exporter
MTPVRSILADRRLRDEIATSRTNRFDDNLSARRAAFEGPADDVVVFCPSDRASSRDFNAGSVISGHSPSIQRARGARLASEVEVAHRGAGHVARSTRVLTPIDSALAMAIFIVRSADSFLQAHLSGRKKAFRPHDLEPRRRYFRWRSWRPASAPATRRPTEQPFPGLPPGTLAANLIGGYIIGLAIAYLAQAPNLVPEWRLFIITGFCGGLITFSTYSAEVVTHLQEGRWVWAIRAIAVHVTGSLAMTLGGFATSQLLKPQ